MMTTYALHRADGGVSILALTSGADLDAEIGKWSDSVLPAWLPVHAHEVAALPAREWRNAWGHADGKVCVPIDRARVVTKDRLRQEREPLLPPNGMGPADRALRYAMLAKDDAAIGRAQVELKRLRDVTKLADGCTTLDALSALTV